jgi:hypothetical protein
MRKLFIRFILLFSVINSYSQETIRRDTVWNSIDSAWYEIHRTKTMVEVDSAWIENRLRSFEDYSIYSKPHYEPFTNEIIFYFRPDIMFNNFDAFESELGEHNIEYLNNSGLMVSFGISARRGKYLAGFILGVLPVSPNGKHDSLNVRMNSTRFGLNFGVDVVNNRRFIVTPRVDLHWNRYRLINSRKDRISLGQYMSEREVDLRFNQMTASMGLDLSYKIYNTKGMICDYWTIGLFGGYIASLNSKPWIYSQNHRLKNKHRTDLQNYTFGFYMSFHYR